MIEVMAGGFAPPNLRAKSPTSRDTRGSREVHSVASIGFHRTHARSFTREALVHAHRSPQRLATLPAPAAHPVLSWGTYRSNDRECSHLGAQFPLRCFQRFLLPAIATQPAGRPTTAPPAGRPIRSSRTKISSPQNTRRP